LTYTWSEPDLNVLGDEIVVDDVAAADEVAVSSRQCSNGHLHCYQSIMQMFHEVNDVLLTSKVQNQVKKNKLPLMQHVPYDHVLKMFPNVRKNSFDYYKEITQHELCKMFVCKRIFQGAPTVSTNVQLHSRTSKKQYFLGPATETSASPKNSESTECLFISICMNGRTQVRTQ
jgi:hypothetical protein